MKVKNLSDYALTKKYILVREVEGDLWFFSAWDDENRANEQALEQDCIVLTRDLVDD